MRLWLLVVVALGAGCVPAFHVGLGTDDRVPELAMSWQQEGTSIRGSFTVGAAFREGDDNIRFEVPGIGTVATVPGAVDLTVLRIGGEILMPAGGRHTVVVGVTAGVTNADAPTLDAAAMATLAAAQITGAKFTSDQTGVGLGLRAEWRVRVGRRGAMGLYAEACTEGVSGSLSYTHTPTGAGTQADTWNLSSARWGVTYSLRF